MAGVADRSDPGSRAAQPGFAGALQRLWRGICKALRDRSAGPHQEELRRAQKQTILSRTVTLIWVSVFVMPTTIWPYVLAAEPAAIKTAIWIVCLALAAVLVLLYGVRRGGFDRHYHLAMLILVGGVFGPTGTAIVEITRASGDFFFAYYLIFFAFTALYPAAAGWVVATSVAVIASWVGGHLFRPEGFVLDQTLIEGVIYLFQLAFIGLVLNRVIVTLFFDERRAHADLRLARDALLAEMHVAQHVQKLLLPTRPRLAEFRVHGMMLPADEVGGDYYDVIVTDAGREFIAIGDVSGHGVTSGLTMMMARTSLLGTLEADPMASLPTLYAALNRGLRKNLERMQLDLYMTFGLFEHTGGGRLQGVGAHPPPFVYRRGTGEVEEVKLEGAWLGIVDSIPAEFLPVVTVELEPGDTVLLYTDGLFEREGSDGDMYGFDRTAASLKSLADESPETVVDGILAEVEAFSSAHDDDVTLVALRYEGGNT